MGKSIHLSETENAKAIYQALKELRQYGLESNFTEEMCREFLYYFDEMGELKPGEVMFAGRPLSLFYVDKRLKPLINPASVTLVPYNSATVVDYTDRTSVDYKNNLKNDLSYERFETLMNEFMNWFTKRGNTANLDSNLQELRQHLLITDVLDRLSDGVHCSGDVTTPETEILENLINVRNPIIPVKGNAFNVTVKDYYTNMFKRLVKYILSTN